MCLVFYNSHFNYSGWEELKNTIAVVLISNLSSIYARQIIALNASPDIGTEFRSRECATYAADYDYRHLTSSPIFRRSNGLAEQRIRFLYDETFRQVY